MKVCFFDIDGTLVLTGRAGMYAFADTFKQEFGVKELTDQVSFSGRSDRGIAGDLFEFHEIENSQENWERFQAGYLWHLKVQLEKRDGQVLPGVVELLDELEKHDDIHVGLLTGNAQQAAKRKLGYYDLWDRFAFGGFGDHHPDRNDIAATARESAIQHHIEMNDTEPEAERIVVIGDTVNDITCARSIGAYAVAVPTGIVSHEDLAAQNPDLLVNTLEDSQLLVDWLLA